MIETGKTLKDFSQNKVIILVWSSIPENFKNTDAHINVWFALWICNILTDRKEYWVYICMNGEYFDIENVQKNENGTFSEIR